MKGYKYGFFGMAALCAALVAAHFVGEAPPPIATPAEPSAVETTAADDTTHTARSPEVKTLRAQLAECRESSWELIAKVVNDQAPASARAAAGGGDADAEYDRQRSALMQIALAHLRNHWKDNRASLLAVMNHVGTEDFVSADVTKKVEAHRARFDLEPADVGRLERGYSELWADHGNTMQQLIKAERWEDLMDEVRGFWQDEDRMVGSILGQSQRDQYRTDDASSRTAIMAILATFSDQPWDDSIAW